MNLRNWTKYHTYGLLIGIATTLVAIPLAIFIYSKVEHFTFEHLWNKFWLLNNEKSKMISYASIANLIWFHTFLRREDWPRAYGIIMATVLNLLAILYFKFLA